MKKKFFSYSASACIQVIKVEYISGVARSLYNSLMKKKYPLECFSLFSSPLRIAGLQDSRTALTGRGRKYAAEEFMHDA